MEIVDKRRETDEWHAGDVIVSKVGNLKGLS